VKTEFVCQKPISYPKQKDDIIWSYDQILKIFIKLNEIRENKNK